MRLRPPSSTLFPYTTLFRSTVGLTVTGVHRAAVTHREPLSGSRETGAATYEVREPDSGSRWVTRSEEHTSELQSQSNLVCRLLLEKKKRPMRFWRPTALTVL